MSEPDVEPPDAAWLCRVNAGSREEALRIGRAVVEERLAAGANVIDGLSSTGGRAGSKKRAKRS